MQRLIQALLDRLPWSWDPRGSRTVSRQDVRDAVLFLVAVTRDETRPPWMGERELLVSVGDQDWEAPIDLAWRCGQIEAVFDHARRTGSRRWEVGQAAAFFATVSLAASLATRAG